MAKVKKRTWINKDGSKGTAWTVDYIDNLGKRVMKSGFKTKFEAEQYLAKIRLELQKGTCINTNKAIIFSQIADEFINSHSEIYCKKSTIISYKGYLKNHLLPYFANRKIIDIKVNEIQSYIKLKQNEGLSAKTINNSLILMGSIFKRAVLQGYIGQNPVYLVKKLKLRKQEMNCLTKEQITMVLNFAKENYKNFYPLLFTAIFTGLRRGELLALTWNDINFETSKITVNKSLFKGTVTTTKTSYSEREVNMSKGLIQVLREWKQKAPKSSINLVFCNKSGAFIDPDNMTKRYFKPCLKACNIENVRFHDLRHTFASLLISENVSIKYIQTQMGHASCQTTLDIYSHILQEVEEKAVSVLDSVLW